MSITIDNSATSCGVRLEGDIDVTCSTDLKRTLVEAISSGKEVQVDLALASDLDVTAIQLLWAARREAEKAGHLSRFPGMCLKTSTARFARQVSRTFWWQGFQKVSQ